MPEGGFGTSCHPGLHVVREMFTVVSETSVFLHEIRAPALR